MALHRARARRPRHRGLLGRAREIPHKGGRTFGFRVSDGHGTLTYISDHCPTALGPGPDGLGVHHEAAAGLAHGADLLIHDAQYLDEELEGPGHFGHASPGYAVALAGRARAPRLLLLPPRPPRTDDEIDAVVAATRVAPPVDGRSRAW